MTGISRNFQVIELQAADSPKVLSFRDYVGLSIALASNADPAPTVHIDAKSDGDFNVEVPMTKNGTIVYPTDSDGMHLLYNAAFIRLTYASGSPVVNFKG